MFFNAIYIFVILYINNINSDCDNFGEEICFVYNFKNIVKIKKVCLLNQRKCFEKKNI